MHRITRGIAGAALAAGLALGGGMAANADSGAAVVEQSGDCRTAVAMKQRPDGYTEYEVKIACAKLDPGVKARAVATFDGGTREVPTPWVSRPRAEAGITIATTAVLGNVRIEYAPAAADADAGADAEADADAGSAADA